MHVNVFYRFNNSFNSLFMCFKLKEINFVNFFTKLEDITTISQQGFLHLQNYCDNFLKHVYHQHLVNSNHVCKE
jgi:hypothetical protein